MSVHKRQIEVEKIELMCDFPTCDQQIKSDVAAQVDGKGLISSILNLIEKIIGILAIFIPN